MAGGAAVAAVRAVTVEAGPGLTAAAAVLTPAGRTPESQRGEREKQVTCIRTTVPSRTVQPGDEQKTACRNIHIYLYAGFL